MSKKEAILLAVFALVFAGAFTFYMKKKYRSNKTITASEQIQGPNNDRADVESAAPDAGMQIWTLPKELDEISANVLVSATEMACIQDNDGIIFFYNLASKKIEKELKFGKPGDYEGLAVAGNVFYVLRSDGFLFEVTAAGAGDPSVKTYDLPLTVENDTEAMLYDSANNRLLIAVKEKDLTEKDKKGVYAFDLEKKRMSTDAVFYIEGNENATSEKEEKENKKGKKKDKEKKKNSIKPSAFAMHPVTKELYILNGPKSELLIADAAGNIKSTKQLDKAIFPQPEGLCFGPNNELYISSEAGKNGRGTIARITL